MRLPILALGGFLFMAGCSPPSSPPAATPKASVSVSGVTASARRLRSPGYSEIRLKALLVAPGGLVLLGAGRRGEDDREWVGWVDEAGQLRSQMSLDPTCACRRLLPMQDGSVVALLDTHDPKTSDPQRIVSCFAEGKARWGHEYFDPKDAVFDLSIEDLSATPRGIVGSGGCLLFCLDPGTGQVKWSRRFPGGDRPRTYALPAGGFVAATSAPDRTNIECFDGDGKMLWRRGVVGTFSELGKNLAFDRDSIYCLGDVIDGEPQRLTRLDLKGNILWQCLFRSTTELDSWEVADLPQGCLIWGSAGNQALAATVDPTGKVTGVLQYPALLAPSGVQAAKDRVYLGEYQPGIASAPLPFPASGPATLEMVAKPLESLSEDPETSQPAQLTVKPVKRQLVGPADWTIELSR